MGMIGWDEFVVDTYDTITDKAMEEGLKVGEIRGKIADAARKAIAKKQLDMPDVEAAVGKSMGSIDTRRRQELPEAILYAAAALNDETILGPDDPSLRQAFPVGDHIRKALRYCGPVDLDGMVSARRQNMANAVAAFDAFASGVDQLKATMRARNAHIVLDLCSPSKDDEDEAS